MSRELDLRLPDLPAGSGARCPRAAEGRNRLVDLTGELRTSSEVVVIGVVVVVDGKR